MEEGNGAMFPGRLRTVYHMGPDILANLENVKKSPPKRKKNIYQTKLPKSNDTPNSMGN